MFTEKMVLGKRRALFALLTASSMLVCASPAVFADEETVTSEQVIRSIVNSQISSEGRAIWLLVFADRILKYENFKSMRNFFSRKDREPTWMLQPAEKNERASLVSWASQTNRYRGGAELAGRSAYVPSAERLALATKTIREAVSLLDESSNEYVKLNAYFVASRLFTRVGAIDAAARTMSNVDRLIEDCEKQSSPDAEQLKAAASLLQEQAFIALSDEPLELVQPPSVDFQRANKAFTDDQFQIAEKFWLRAVKLLDGLDSKSHFRRKAHRDLVLWYMFFGKDKLASKEKEVLFDLVGVRDDSILYPKYRGCGSLVWWNSETTTQGGMLCGLG